MEKVHWAGGLRLPKQRMLRGWPCCCSGERAEVIRQFGLMNAHEPEQVTCKRCQALLRKAGLLRKAPTSDEIVASKPQMTRPVDAGFYEWLREEEESSDE
jgi:hypothetical protein